MKKTKKANRIKSVDIGGQRFTVDWIDISKTPEKGNWGYCAMDDNTIVMEESLLHDRREAASVLSHEMAHAFFEVTGYRHVEGVAQCEEGIVRALEYIYAPALMDALDRL